MGVCDSGHLELDLRSQLVAAVLARCHPGEVGDTALHTHAICGEPRPFGTVAAVASNDELAEYREYAGDQDNADDLRGHGYTPRTLRSWKSFGR